MIIADSFEYCYPLICPGARTRIILVADSPEDSGIDEVSLHSAILLINGQTQYKRKA